MFTRVACETMLSPVIVRCYVMSLMLVCTWYKHEQFKSRGIEDNQSFCRMMFAFFTEWIIIKEEPEAVLVSQ